MKKVITTLALALVCMTNANAQFGKLKGLANKVKSAAASVVSSEVSSATGVSSSEVSSATGVSSVASTVSSSSNNSWLEDLGKECKPYSEKSFAKNIALEDITTANSLEDVIGAVISRIIMMENAVKSNDESVMYHHYMNAFKFLEKLNDVYYKYKSEETEKLRKAIRYWKAYCTHDIDIYKYQDDLMGDLDFSFGSNPDYTNIMAYANKVKAEPAGLKKCLMYELLYNKMYDMYVRHCSHKEITELPEEYILGLANSKQAAQDKAYTEVCENILASIRPYLKDYGYSDMGIMNNAKVKSLYFEAKSKGEKWSPNEWVKLSQSSLSADLKQRIVACAKSEYPDRYVDVFVNKNPGWRPIRNSRNELIIECRAMTILVVFKEEGKYFAIERYVNQDYLGGGKYEDKVNLAVVSRNIKPIDYK